MITIFIILAIVLIALIALQKAELTKTQAELDKFVIRAAQAEHRLRVIKETNDQLDRLKATQREEMMHETTAEHLAKRIDFESDFDSVSGESTDSTVHAGAVNYATDPPSVTHHSRRATDVSG